MTGGGPQSKGKLTIVLDGYSAPITAGNFAAEVLKGSLNGRRLDASYTSVLAEANSKDSDGMQLQPSLLSRSFCLDC